MADVGSVTIIRDTTASRPSAGPTGARMRITSESGRLALAVDIAPQEIEYGGLPLEWSQAERSGEKPLLLHQSIPLRTMAFSFLMTDRFSMQTPQTSKFAVLRDIARTFERVLVAFSPTEQGLWRITDLSVNSQLRTAATDEISRATVSITLTEAADPAAAVGPISKPPPPPPAPAPVNRTYRVVKGDTLWGIAKRYYGNGALWPRIFDANRGIIKDPHWIYANQTFVIP